MDEEPLAAEVETEAVAEPTPPRRSHWRRYVWLSALAVLVAAGAWAAVWWSGWSHAGQLEPSGGLYFVKRTELKVPLFRQGDPQWRAESLGPTTDTLGAAGCALTSAAMVMAYYGIDTDPHRLNEFLNSNGGYTDEGWIYWEKAADLAPDRVRKVWEDLGSYEQLDLNLLRGNPVIVKLRLRSGTTHFVVVAGKEGYDYLIRDPGAGGAKGMYPLKDLGSRILGLRYYERLK